MKPTTNRNTNNFARGQCGAVGNNGRRRPPGFPTVFAWPALLLLLLFCGCATPRPTVKMIPNPNERPNLRIKSGKVLGVSKFEVLTDTQFQIRLNSLDRADRLAEAETQFAINEGKRRRRLAAAFHVDPDIEEAIRNEAVKPKGDPVISTIKNAALVIGGHLIP